MKLYSVTIYILVLFEQNAQSARFDGNIATQWYVQKLEQIFNQYT